MILNRIKALFHKNQRPEVPPMPEWDQIVEMMYDKNLNVFCGEVVRVIYSKDRTMRYVVLKDKRGLLTYHSEVIYQYDEDEWKYIFSFDNILPAKWVPFHGFLGKSFFINEDELFKEMKTEPEYKMYF